MTDLYWPDKPMHEITVGEFRELVEGDVIKEIIRLAIELPQISDMELND